MLYKLVAKLYDKDKLVGYRLLNRPTNKTYDEDIQSVKVLAHKGKTCTIDVNGLKINYINMNEFLLNPKNYL